MASTRAMYNTESILYFLKYYALVEAILALATGVTLKKPLTLLVQTVINKKEAEAGIMLLKYD